MAIKNITSLFTKSQALKVTNALTEKDGVAKKVAKKSSVRKAVNPKKVTEKKVAKKVVSKKIIVVKKTKAHPLVRLVVASDSESFWVTDGQVLNSVIALELALTTMKKSVYDYHALLTGNHFADWVEMVLADTKLATILRPIKTAKTAAAAIKKHLKTAKN